MAKKRAAGDEDKQASSEADALQRTLNQIHKQYGDGAIMPLGAIGSARIGHRAEFVDEKWAAAQSRSLLAEEDRRPVVDAHQNGNEQQHGREDQQTQPRGQQVEEALGNRDRF